MNYQRLYFIFGILLSLVFIFYLILFILTDSISVITVLNYGAFTYMVFAISYLYPQFKHKDDDRIKQIRQKGSYYTIFVVLIVLIVSMIFVQYNLISFTLTAVDSLRLLFTLIIVTIWTSWIILVERM